MLDRDDPLDVKPLEEFSPPALRLHLYLPVQLFDELTQERETEFTPTGHQIPKPIARSVIRQELDEIGIEGDLRSEVLRRVKLCDRLYLEERYAEIERKLKEESAKRNAKQRG